MSEERNTVAGGKVKIYRRKGSPKWQCSAFAHGRNWRVSTNQESLKLAKDFAEDWYLTLLGKLNTDNLFQGQTMPQAIDRFLTRTRTLISRAGSDAGAASAFADVGDKFLQRLEALIERSGQATRVNSGKTFKDAADQFVMEAASFAAHSRGRHYMSNTRYRLNAHLIPYFGQMPLVNITEATLQDYRLHRMSSRIDPHTKEPRIPRPSTMHSEMITLGQVLKTAKLRGWISYVPETKELFRRKKALEPRPWFTPEDYKKLYQATRERAANPKKERWRWSAEQLHDFVLLLANTGIRPDEAKNLRFSDVTIAYDKTCQTDILHIQVQGKTGYGPCLSMPGAVRPFMRLRDRMRTYVNDRPSEGRHAKRANPELQRKPSADDKLFPTDHTELLNEILKETGLKFDHRGRARTAYSLRHSYICFALLEGNDKAELARNCRTSVKMIDDFYGSHIPALVDTSKINRRTNPGRLSAWGQENI